MRTTKAWANWTKGEKPFFGRVNMGTDLQRLRDQAETNCRVAAANNDRDSADAWERIAMTIDDCQKSIKADLVVIEVGGLQSTDDPSLVPFYNELQNELAELDARRIQRCELEEWRDLAAHLAGIHTTRIVDHAAAVKLRDAIEAHIPPSHS